MAVHTHTHSIYAVPPATPSNVNISSINSSHVAITWSLYPLTPDENADSFTLELTPLNGDLASMRRVLQGGSRLAALQVAAGTNYTLRLTAVNVDGTVPTAPVLFSAPPEGQRSWDCVCMWQYVD